MVRGNTLEEIEHLEDIAIKLGEFLMRSISLNDKESIAKWTTELKEYVLQSDQYSLRYIMFKEASSAPELISDNDEYINYYVSLINQMRDKLYELKVSNRQFGTLPRELTIGNYKLFYSGRIVFKGKEIAFTGKLRELLRAFLENNGGNYTLSADDIVRLWGDDNRARAPRHRDDLNKALKPYYGDGKNHINKISTNPLLYQLDII